MSGVTRLEPTPERRAASSAKRGRCAAPRPILRATSTPVPLGEPHRARCTAAELPQQPQPVPTNSQLSCHDSNVPWAPILRPNIGNPANPGVSHLGGCQPQKWLSVTGFKPAPRKDRITGRRRRSESNSRWSEARFSRESAARCRSSARGMATPRRNHARSRSFSSGEAGTQASGSTAARWLVSQRSESSAARPVVLGSRHELVHEVAVVRPPGVDARHADPETRGVLQRYPGHAAPFPPGARRVRPRCERTPFASERSRSILRSVAL